MNSIIYDLKKIITIKSKTVFQSDTLKMSHNIIIGFSEMSYLNYRPYILKGL